MNRIKKEFKRDKTDIVRANTSLRKLARNAKTESALSLIYNVSRSIYLNTIKKYNTGTLIALARKEFKKTIRVINNKAKKLNLNKQWQI